MKNNNNDGVILTLVNPQTKRTHKEHFNIGDRFSISPDQFPADNTGGFLPDTTTPTAVIDGQETQLDDVIEANKEYEVVEEVDEYENRTISIQPVGEDDDE